MVVRYFVEASLGLGLIESRLGILADRVDVGVEGEGVRAGWGFVGWFLGVAVVCAVVWPGVLVGVIGLFEDAEVRWVGQMYERKLGMLRESEGVAGDGPAREGLAGGRVVIFGGSGTLLGFDGDVLEAGLGGALGGRVINLGTHGALGGHYQMRLVKRELARGDTALLCIAYRAWREDAEWPSFMWNYVVSHDWGDVREQGWGAVRGLMGYPLQDVGAGLVRWADRLFGGSSGFGGYGAVRMTRQGDVRFAESVRGQAFEPAEIPEEISPRFERAMGELAVWCRENGVGLKFVWPNAWVGDSEAEMAEAARRLEPYERMLERVGVEAVGRPAEHFFPRRMFYDTHYHMTDAGRRLRSERLVDALGGGREREEVYFVMGGAEHEISARNLAAAGWWRFRELGEGGLSAAEAIELARAGKVVVMDGGDWAARRAIALAGAGTKVVEGGRVTLGGLAGRYGEHVLVVKRGDGTAAVRGTGKYAGVVKDVGGPGAILALGEVVAVGEELGGWRASVGVSAGAAGRVWVGGELMGSKAGEDYCVVIEPRWGTVVWAGVVAAGEGAVEWSLARVVPAGMSDFAAVRAEEVETVDMGAFAATGVNVPAVEMSGDGARVTFSGPTSVYGLDLRTWAKRAEGEVTLEYSLGRGSTVVATVLASDEGGFVSLPADLVLEAGERRQVTLAFRRRGKEIGEQDYAVLGVMGQEAGRQIVIHGARVVWRD